VSPGRRTFSAARVIERREVARDTVVVQYAVDLEGPVLPGQFAMVHPGDDDRYVLPRPLSILRYSEGRMDLLIKVVGRGSHELAAMQPGEELRVFAPLGRPFDPGEFMNRPSVLVAGGVGIVPLHLLSSELRSCGEAPRPIFGARTPDDLPRELLGEEPAGPWQLWVESGARAGLRKGLVTDGLLEALEDTPDAIVATCGPTPMMHAVARICRERDVELRVCLEEQMGCGSGVCRACVIDDARDGRRRTVCQEGPVFDVRSIVFLPEDRPGPAAGGATS
jgi:dihydroorotate dehydrogenase electron transfer subunit